VRDGSAAKYFSLKIRDSSEYWRDEYAAEIDYRSSSTKLTIHPPDQRAARDPRCDIALLSSSPQQLKQAVKAQSESLPPGFHVLADTTGVESVLLILLGVL